MNKNEVDIHDGIYSWGRINKAYPSELIIPDNISPSYIKSMVMNQDFYKDKPILAFGNGRSYGDSSYNDDGLMIANMRLNKFIDFDREQGILSAEAGILLADILDLIIPCGWFLPVTPGTKFVSLAGAVANDVHGKNHHKDGSFGIFVKELHLARSDGSVLVCSRESNTNMFFATIGGLGLTGWITRVTIQLIKIQNPFIITNSFKFANLSEYFALNKRLESSNKYTVAWIDCLSSGSNIGRGIYYTGEHAGSYDDHQVKWQKLNKSKKNFLITPPFSLVNKFSLKAFNTLYYKQKIYSDTSKLDYYDRFFYPLDRINNWNRMYGKKGFYQYQCVVPLEYGLETMTEILQSISKSKTGSFLAVLKTFGEKCSGGLLSFPRKGVTLALDFANKGDTTLNLFSRLDDIVKNANGALYPAKDGRIDAKMFKLGMPRLDEFIQYIDPHFSSNLWRRVNK